MSAGIDEIVAEAIDKKPSPSDASTRIAQEALQQLSAPSGTETEATPDAAPVTPVISVGGSSEIFNPEIHAVDKDGKPSRNNDGSFRKKRGRKKGSDTGSKIASQYNAPPDDAKFRQAGIASANVIFVCSTIVFGEEWTPQVQADKGINEPQMMADAFSEYYKATGIVEVPAWLGLAIALTAYSLPRLSMPKTKEKIGLIWEKVSAKFGGEKVEAENA